MDHRDHAQSGALSAFPNNQSNSISNIDGAADEIVAKVPVPAAAQVRAFSKALQAASKASKSNPG